ncbi:nucleotidyl transferase AbiEii/AbiGii toxin family protein [Novipirellula sp.]|uniref:nucleotidyl transferase AbiEii/AbiGii toxin family protein n=1 Tax=Novipirellula sp. TaxID=2795430 RepID=UPI00356499D4
MTHSDAQRRLWPELIDVPDSFTLYGGTAIALRLGHRQSVDFDFFGNEDFDPDALLGKVPFLRDAEVTQKSANTLTAKINRGKDVSVSFFGVPELKRLRGGDTVDENGITVASIYDLAGTKVAVVQKRAEVKDYIDIDAMIEAKVIDLPQALRAGRMVYGKQFNPELTLKALCYFEDGSVRKLPQETRKRLVAAVQKVDLANLPLLGQSASDRDQGLSR